MRLHLITSRKDCGARIEPEVGGIVLLSMFVL